MLISQLATSTKGNFLRYTVCYVTRNILNDCSKRKNDDDHRSIPISLVENLTVQLKH